MNLPLVVNICFTFLGYGPALTIFWWERRLSGSMLDKSWRHIGVQIKRLEVIVQWV
jgi:hypothetical protein